MGERPDDREGLSPHLARIERESGTPGLVDALADRLSGPDLATVLMEVARRRARRTTPARLMQRYAHDRFVAPATLAPGRLRRAEDVLTAALPESFELVTLAPVVPLGTHSALATVNQSRIVTTIRGTEVAADPTNALALEAATRRRSALRDSPRSAQRIHLASSQRVVRAQIFEDPTSFAHFQLFGLVTAGRDGGNLSFELTSVVEHVGFIVRSLVAASAAAILVKTTDFTGGELSRISERLQATRASENLEVVDDPDRVRGRGYYDRFCFKVFARWDSRMLEIADGGFTNWTQSLLQSRKERLLISGVGVDRLAMSMA